MSKPHPAHPASLNPPPAAVAPALRDATRQPLAGRSRRHGLALLGGALLASALPGCASGPQRAAPADERACRRDSAGERAAPLCVADAVPSAEVEAEARRLLPDARRLTVVVIRQRWADAVNRVPLIVDGSHALETLPASFVRLRLAPGRHVLRTSWGGSEPGAPSQTAELIVDGQAGELLCVELVGSVWLWRTQYHLQPTTPAQAADRVRGLRLVADRS